MIRLISNIFFVFLPLPLHAQAGPPDSYFSQLRTGKYPNVVTEINKPENAKAFLNVLPFYLMDTVTIIHIRAAYISYAPLIIQRQRARIICGLGQISETHAKAYLKSKSVK